MEASARKRITGLFTESELRIYWKAVFCEHSEWTIVDVISQRIYQVLLDNIELIISTIIWLVWSTMPVAYALPFFNDADIVSGLGLCYHHATSRVVEFHAEFCEVWSNGHITKSWNTNRVFRYAKRIKEAIDELNLLKKMVRSIVGNLIKDVWRGSGRLDWFEKSYCDPGHGKSSAVINATLAIGRRQYSGKRWMAE